MSFFDPQHPIHPEHVPLLAAIPAFIAWLWFKLRGKNIKKK